MLCCAGLGCSATSLSPFRALFCSSLIISLLRVYVKAIEWYLKRAAGIVDSEEDVDSKKVSVNNKISVEDFQKLRTQNKD